MSDRKVGRVDWYNISKGYGVIRGEDNLEYFLHHSNVPPEIQSIKKGMQVSFRYRKRHKDKKGFEAFDSRVLVNDHEQNNNFIEGNKHYSYYKSLENQKEEPISRTINSYDIETFGEQQIESGSNYWLNSLLDSPKLDRETHPYTVKVVGVTYEGRQAIVAQLEVGEELFLVREPFNAYDPNAIRVERNNKQQVGYIDRYLAAQISSNLDELEYNLPAQVVELLGGYSDYSSLGVRIEFRIPQ